LKAIDAGPRIIVAWRAGGGRMTGRYSALSFTRHHAQGVYGIRHHGATRLAAILLLSTVLEELRGAGTGTIWERLNGSSDEDLDEDLGALLLALADDRRRVLDLRLGRLRDRAGSVSAEWLHELERRVDMLDDA
jgi:hypothetical protein